MANFKLIHVIIYIGPQSQVTPLYIPWPATTCRKQENHLFQSCVELWPEPRWPRGSAGHRDI